MKAIVSTQNPIVLSRHSEPQPDLALLKPREDFYRNGHPSAVDVLLVIEVADRTLRYDQEIKAPLYARHGIPELWIVDLENRCLRLYRGPSETGYQQEQTIQNSEALASLALLNTSVNLSGCLHKHPCFAVRTRIVRRNHMS
jgi:Uma2 family endonuclease